MLPPEPKTPVDTMSPELARLRAELAAMKQEMEGLKNRKTTTTVINNGEKGAARTATVPRALPAPCSFVSHDISKRGAGPGEEGARVRLSPHHAFCRARSRRR